MPRVLVTQRMPLTPQMVTRCTFEPAAAANMRAFPHDAPRFFTSAYLSRQGPKPRRPQREPSVPAASGMVYTRKVPSCSASAHDHRSLVRETTAPL